KKNIVIFCMVGGSPVSVMILSLFVLRYDKRGVMSVAQRIKEPHPPGISPADDVLHNRPED
ncbi:MAG TPA: hypothetical protein VF929_12180, partial [Gemmatimonadaceae bacterium]